MNGSERRLSIAWLVPLAVLLVVGWISFDVYSTRGVEVSVSFPDGHGLGPGDTVRCRGIEVGSVRSVQLVDSGVEVALQLDPANATQLARAGSRWWVSRPKLDWSRVSGLDSLVGPRFIRGRSTHRPFRCRALRLPGTDRGAHRRSNRFG